MTESARSIPESAARPLADSAANAAVGAVHVQPHAARAAQVRQLVERVDGAGVGRARVGADDERPQAGGRVRGHGALQRVDAQVTGTVHRHHAHALGPEAERPRRSRHRRVALRRDVHDEVVAHGAREPLAGAGERREVRRRPAAHQHSRGVGRVADPLREPPQHGELQLRHAGAAGPPAAVEIEGAGDEVAHGAGPRREAGDEGHVAGCVRPAAKRRHVAEDPLQHLLVGQALLGRRRLQAPPQVVLRRIAKDGLRRATRHLVHQGVDGAVPDLAHAFRVQTE